MTDFADLSQPRDRTTSFVAEHSPIAAVNNLAASGRPPHCGPLQPDKADGMNESLNRRRHRRACNHAKTTRPRRRERTTFLRRGPALFRREVRHSATNGTITSRGKCPSTGLQARRRRRAASPAVYRSIRDSGSQTVGRRFDVDHVGSILAEGVRDDRSGPERGELVFRSAKDEAALGREPLLHNGTLDLCHGSNWTPKSGLRVLWSMRRRNRPAWSTVGDILVMEAGGPAFEGSSALGGTVAVLTVT